MYISLFRYFWQFHWDCADNRVELDSIRKVQKLEFKCGTKWTERPVGFAILQPSDLLEGFQKSHRKPATCWKASIKQKTTSNHWDRTLVTRWIVAAHPNDVYLLHFQLQLIPNYIKGPWAQFLNYMDILMLTELEIQITENPQHDTLHLWEEILHAEAMYKKWFNRDIMVEEVNDWTRPWVINYE